MSSNIANITNFSIFNYEYSKLKLLARCLLYENLKTGFCAKLIDLIAQFLSTRSMSSY